MAELTTIARPYAEAVFKRAAETKNFTVWSDALQLMAAIATDENMTEVMAGSQFSKSELADLFNEIAGTRIDQEAKNLVRLLAENRRLPLLTEIAVQYELSKQAAPANTVCLVELCSAAIYRLSRC